MEGIADASPLGSADGTVGSVRRDDSLGERSHDPSVVRWVRAAARAVCIVLLIGLVLDILYEIIGREFFGGSAVWTQESSEFVLIWLVLVGSVVVVANRAQPSVQAVADRLPAGWPRVIQGGVVDVASLTVYMYMVVGGWRLVNALSSEHAVSFSLGLSWVALAIPVSGLGMLIVHIAHAISDHRVRGLIVVAAAALVCGVLDARLFTIPQGAFAWLVLFAFVALLAGGTPIAEALLCSGLLGFILAEPQNTDVSFASHLYTSLENFSLVAIPLFLLAGLLMAATGCAQRIIALARQALGWLPGGLGIADVVASAVFADMSGSATADSVAIGTIMLPELERAGYPRPSAAGLQAAAGTLGIMFPPSITALLYAYSANVSVSSMFAALILPGVLVAVSFMIVNAVITSRAGYDRRTRFSPTGITKSFGRATPALGAPLVILGGIFGGIFTVTEAGAIAVLYVVLAGGLAYRELTVHNAAEALAEAVQNAARVGFVVLAALTFGWLLFLSQAPQRFVNWLVHVTDVRWLMVLLVLVMLLVAHTVLENALTVLVIVPVLAPTLLSKGVDLVHFGVLFDLTSAVGLVMPPLGICLYMISSISGVRLERLARAVIPYFAALLADLALVFLIPSTTSVIPALFGMG